MIAHMERCVDNYHWLLITHGIYSALDSFHDFGAIQKEAVQMQKDCMTWQ